MNETPASVPTDYAALSVPEIDAHIRRACTRYFREQGECPRLCLVSPLWWRKTIRRSVRIGLPAVLGPEALFRDQTLGELASFTGPEVVTVELLPFREHRQAPPFTEEMTQEAYWVLPLGRADILRLMEDAPTLGLPPGMTMASLMSMSETERAHLERHRFEEQHRNTFENWWRREFYGD